MDNSKEKDPQIQNVLFDLGGVIFRIDWTLTNRVLDIPESFDWWNSTEYDRYERGQLSGPEFQTAIEKKYNKSWSKDLFRKALQDLILECLPGIEEILKKTKVPIYALSNTCEAHKEVFEKTQVMTYFKRVVTSFEIASRKPERTAFQKCLEILNIKSQSCLYFDDRTENVRSAQTCGFIAYQSLNSSQKTALYLERHAVLHS